MREHPKPHLLLELLIGIVDTELLERVDNAWCTPSSLWPLIRIVLKAVDIEHTDEGLRNRSSLSILTSQAFIDHGDQPLKQTSVDEFSDAVSNNGRLGSVEGGDDLFRTCGNLFLDGPLFELDGGEPKKFGGEKQSRVFVVDVSVVSRCSNFDVPQVQQSSQQPEDCPLLLYADAYSR